MILFKLHNSTKWRLFPPCSMEKTWRPRGVALQLCLEEPSKIHPQICGTSEGKPSLHTAVCMNSTLLHAAGILAMSPLSTRPIFSNGASSDVGQECAQLQDSSSAATAAGVAVSLSPAGDTDASRSVMQDFWESVLKSNNSSRERPLLSSPSSSSLLPVTWM